MIFQPFDRQEVEQRLTWVFYHNKRLPFLYWYRSLRIWIKAALYCYHLSQNLLKAKLFDRNSEWTSGVNFFLNTVMINSSRHDQRNAISDLSWHKGIRVFPRSDISRHPGIGSLNFRGLTFAAASETITYFI